MNKRYAVFILYLIISSFFIFSLNGKASDFYSISNQIKYAFTDTQFTTPSSRYGFGYLINANDDFFVSHSTKTGGKSIYVFNRDELFWSENKIIQANTSDGPSYNTKLSSSAISENFLVVGEPEYNPTGKFKEGNLSVYRWNGSSWVSESLILADEYRQEGANLGYSVAIEGDTLVAGAPGWDILNDGTGARRNDAGRIYVFKRDSGSVWRLQKVLENPRQPTSNRSYNELGKRVQIANQTILGIYNDDLREIGVWDFYGGNWEPAEPFYWSGKMYDFKFDGEFFY